MTSCMLALHSMLVGRIYLELSRAAMRNLQLSGWLCSCPRKSWNLATALSPPGSLRTKQRSRLPVFAVMSGVGFCNTTHVFGNWRTLSLPTHGMQTPAEALLRLIFNWRYKDDPCMA